MLTWVAEGMVRRPLTRSCKGAMLLIADGRRS